MANQRDKGGPGSIDPRFEIRTIFPAAKAEDPNWRLEKSRLQKVYAEMLSQAFPELARAYAAAVAIAEQDEDQYLAEIQRVAAEFFERAPIDRALFPTPESVLNAFRFFEKEIVARSS
jgi:hypothetical protein